MATNVAAAILAGGRARRIGGLNKTGLHVGALRIIDRQLAVLRRFADPLFVVAAHGSTFQIHARILRGELKAADVIRDVCVEEIGPELLATYDPHGVQFTNVNTPHDYERILQMLEREPGQREDRIMNDSTEC